MKFGSALGALLLLSAITTPAAAQEASSPASAPANTTDAAAAAPSVTPICTDRPTKANVACTVPAGQIQIEADVVNWTTNTFAGTRTDVVLYTNPTVKLGLGQSTDLELNIAPYETVRARGGGSVDTLGGVGDLFIRLKQEVTSSSAKTQVSLIPYIKAPTARLGIGNGKVEGGVIAPIVFTLPKNFTLNFGPEIDVLENGNFDGHHVQFVSLVNLAKTVGKATFYAEFWNAQNFDPAGTIHQYSADAAVAYLITPVVQVDVGGNFGLNRQTPDAQLYVGISTRF